MPTTISTAVWPPPDADGVLLVIAHPDDEAMFFAPAVTAVTGGGSATPTATTAPIPLRLLCLSTGDADGLGQTRARELVKAAQSLGIDRANVTVLDDPRLRDGMRERWDERAVGKAVAGELRRAVAAAAAGTTRRRGQGSTKGWALLTFDARGVSGHPNHRDTSRGVAGLLVGAGQGGGGGGGGRATARAAAATTTTIQTPNIHSVWQLRSEPLLLKFLGPFGAALGVLLALVVAALRQRPVAVVPASQPVLASLRAMRLHASQWVWFRWLFVLLSSYGWVNVVERVVV